MAGRVKRAIKGAAHHDHDPHRQETRAVHFQIAKNFTAQGCQHGPPGQRARRDGVGIGLDALDRAVVLESGHPITTKGYDYANYERADKPDVLIAPPEVLVLEGIHMFYDKRLCERMSLKVYLHVDVDICLLRRIKRDIKARGRSIDNIAEQYIDTVKPVYEKYIANYINDADFAVMRGGKNKMAIDAISAYLTTKVLAEHFVEPECQQNAAGQSCDNADMDS